MPGQLRTAAEHEGLGAAAQLSVAWAISGSSPMTEYVRVLWMLASRRGELVTREEIRQELQKTECAFIDLFGSHLVTVERVERLEHPQVGAGNHLRESSDGGHLLCSRRPRPRS